LLNKDVYVTVVLSAFWSPAK